MFTSDSGKVPTFALTPGGAAEISFLTCFGCKINNKSKAEMPSHPSLYLLSISHPFLFTCTTVFLISICFWTAVRVNWTNHLLASYQKSKLVIFKKKKKKKSYTRNRTRDPDTKNSPLLTSPHLTSPHLTSPHFTSLHLTSPHSPPHPTSPHTKGRGS